MVAWAIVWIELHITQQHYILRQANTTFTRACWHGSGTARHAKVAVWTRAVPCRTVPCWLGRDSRAARYGTAQLDKKSLVWTKSCPGTVPERWTPRPQSINTRVYTLREEKNAETDRRGVIFCLLSRDIACHTIKETWICLLPVLHGTKKKFWSSSRQEHIQRQLQEASSLLLAILLPCLLDRECHCRKATNFCMSMSAFL